MWLVVGFPNRTSRNPLSRSEGAASTCEGAENILDNCFDEVFAAVIAAAGCVILVDIALYIHQTYNREISINK